MLRGTNDSEDWVDLDYLADFGNGRTRREELRTEI